ncbi:symmetrical bis(5'-nucleosyl)-tetraphosphatase [Comamonas composti]|uniref:symmetrical bis(5'-nucleosyl)-tetraphosphatase n=1 Tax=Comamonas composti TaxID=408558 RepID=UPI000411476E|nr:symmetrical bis(5'-nucleosyl)-tetraphosphatase [Comamonas composti]
MALYCIGDIQGCHDAFERLLSSVDFSPSRDILYVLGDLVNRGPASDKVLRTCMEAGDAMRSLLGNHDLHLLAAAHGLRRSSRRDTLDTVLEAPDRPALLDWLRQQPLAREHRMADGQGLLMVHAGVLPQWSAQQTLDLAAEVHDVLRGPGLSAFLQAMYGNQPDHWSSELEGPDRLRLIVNALTRLRFCSAQGVMDFESTESAEQAPAGLMPWFDVPGRATASQVIAFGHWSTLGHLNRPDLVALDTGCVWGGCLSMMRFGSTLDERELIQVPCPQAQAPGK